ncbi:MAG: MFS transporter [Simkaniaceae bacterium]
MSLFKRKKSSRFEEFLNRLPFKKKEVPFHSRFSIHFHNMTQFGGALNDNVFKYLIVFLLFNLKGVASSSEVLFWIGIVYVLPFLLFSSAAGVLADRISKQRIILFLKFTEIIIILLSFFAFAAKSEWACYTLMFLLSAQSAFFSPPKYSIIPELVEKKRISHANGLITSSTYLAIILGTFLATAATQITNKNFVIAAILPFIIALFGFVTALFISYTKPKGTKKKINPFFISEIYKTLRFTSLRPHLFVSIIASAFFLFVGAFVQLEIIPYAIKALGRDEVFGGYLFLVVAIGIALGAVIAGKICKKRIELGMCCLAGLGMSLVFILLDYFSSNLFAVIILLILMGVLGGLFIVPFDSFIQTNSPENKRGQIIAASSFLSFCGVAIAPITIYLLGGPFALSPEASFFTVGFFILLFMILIIMGLSQLSFHFFTKLFIKPFFNIEQIHSPLQETDPLTLFLPRYSRLRTYLLFAISPNVEVFFFKKKKGFFDPLLYLITSYKWVYYQDDPLHSMTKLIESDLIRGQKGAISLITFHQLYESDALKMEASIKKGHRLYRRLDMKFSLTSYYRWRHFWKFMDVVMCYHR